MNAMLSPINIFMCVLSVASLASAAEESPLTATARFQPSSISAGGTPEIKVSLDLAKNYHAYVDKFKLTIESPDDLKLDALKIAPIISFEDPFSHKTRASVEDRSELRALVEVPRGFKPGKNLVHFKLVYQACTLDHCLFPKTISIEAPLEVVADGAIAGVAANDAPRIDGTTISMQPPIPATTPPAVARTPVSDSLSSRIFSTADFDFATTLGHGTFVALMIVFLMGLLTSFTPCIYPMIPITLAILGTRTKDQPKWKGFTLSAFYVLGIAAMYSLLGVAAAETGAFFGAALSNVYVVSAIAVVFVVMAMSMYGFFELQMPALIRNRLGAQSSGTGYSGAFAAGLIAGVVASPCVGPVLVSILAHIASTRNTLQGFTYLFTFALGLGVPFLVLGTSSSLLNKIPKAGAWMDLTKFIFGSVMIAMALYYIHPLSPNWLFLVLSGVALVFIAVTHGAFKSSAPTFVARFAKGTMLTFVCLGLALIAFGGARRAGVLAASEDGSDLTASYKKLPWKTYSENLVAEAVAAHRPILVDFSAEWCVACMELEHHTFTDDQVAALSEKFTLLKVDATEESPAFDVLKEKYGIVGLPTLIFYGVGGAVRGDLTLTGFEEAKPFAERMTKAFAN